MQSVQMNVLCAAQLLAILLSLYVYGFALENNVGKGCIVFTCFVVVLHCILLTGG